jgi:hypothetical protein
MTKTTIQNGYAYVITVEGIGDRVVMRQEPRDTVVLTKAGAKDLIADLIARFGTEVLPVGYSKTPAPVPTPAPTFRGREETVRVSMPDTNGNYAKSFSVTRQGGHIEFKGECPRYGSSFDYNITPELARELAAALNKTSGLAYPETKYAPGQVVDVTVPAAPRRRVNGSQKYQGNGAHSWELVTGNNGDKTERLRVPGGYIYRDNIACAATFVPMPDAVGYAV